MLRGHLGSYHQKQLAQELVRKIDGVQIIVNRLVVDCSELTGMLSEMVPASRLGCQSAGSVQANQASQGQELRSA